MVLPRLYVPLCCISYVNLRWDQMKRFPFFCHKCFKCIRALIIQNVYFWFQTSIFQCILYILYTLVSSVLFFDFVGSTMMEFKYCLYATIMYLYTCADVTGNLPVWSVYILDENSITNKNTWCDRVKNISSSDKTFVDVFIHRSFFLLL